MATKYEEYLEAQLAHFQSVLEDMGCRPILFVGSGLSQRYLDAPSWRGLLEWLVGQAEYIKRPYGFFAQKATDEPAIASMLVDMYQDNAWDNVHASPYPNELFDGSHQPDVFLKHTVASRMQDLLQRNYHDVLLSHPYTDELVLLGGIEPHAIITTNYDCLLEAVFPDFQVEVGQDIIRRRPYATIGELLKVHGCASSPETLVLTTKDYEAFMETKKYLSAKLLTYFVEFPMVLIGYSASDANIRRILRDIAEMVPQGPDERMDNIWLVRWDPDVASVASPQTEHIFDLGDGRSLRVNVLVVSEFGTLFEAMAKPVPIKKADVKLLRLLQANLYEIVTHTSAKAGLSVKLDALRYHTDSDHLTTVLGFGDVEPGTALQASHPHMLKEVANRLGFKTWQYAEKLLQQVRDESGIDIKATNNQYHQMTPYSKSKLHRYSEKLVELLLAVKAGQAYAVYPAKGRVVEVAARPRR